MRGVIYSITRCEYIPIRSVSASMRKMVFEYITPRICHCRLLGRVGEEIELPITEQYAGGIQRRAYMEVFTASFVIGNSISKKTK